MDESPKIITHNAYVEDSCSKSPNHVVNCSDASSFVGPRKRGRPRKEFVHSAMNISVQGVPLGDISNSYEQNNKKRGRPRKENLSPPQISPKKLGRPVVKKCFHVSEDYDISVSSVESYKKVGRPCKKNVVPSTSSELIYNPVNSFDEKHSVGSTHCLCFILFFDNSLHVS